MSSSTSGPAFSYSDLLDSLVVLRNSAYGREIIDLVNLIMDAASSIDVKAMLRYFVRRGTLLQRGTGESRRYVLSAPAPGRELIALKIQKSQQRWHGTWDVLTYDVPEHANTSRRRLRRSLHQMGFGMLTASSWVSPYDWLSTIEGLRTRLGSEGVFSYIRSAEIVPMGASNPSYPANVWNTQDVYERYAVMAARCADAPQGKDAMARRVRARTAFWATQELASLEAADPMLPRELLANDWPRTPALDHYEQLRRAVQADVNELDHFGA